MEVLLQIFPIVDSAGEQGRRRRQSTNQAEDPGATDNLDVVLGPQDPALFKLPAHCKNIINKGCPPDWP